MISTVLGMIRKKAPGAGARPNAYVVKSPQERQAGKGSGNWACWLPEETGQLLKAAAGWAGQLPPGNKYWLCWNINDEWCRLQQRLVLEAGWTPVVGADRGVARPTVLPGAIYLDFNAGLDMPSLWFHFPLELAFAWVDRLAFWHSDVLLPPAVMREYARGFEALAGPETAAVYCRRSSYFRARATTNAPRWFEVIGCTTRRASQSQFDCAGGWWRHIQNHPNCIRPPRVAYHWDHGGGIAYWEREHGGRVQRITLAPRYHFSPPTRPEVRRDLPRGEALARLDLEAVAAELGLGKFLGS